MLRSNIKNPDRSDFDRIKDPQHILKVWEVIEKNIEQYFAKMIADGDDSAVLKTNGSFRVKASTIDAKKRLLDIFNNGILRFQKDDFKYKSFFSEESMHEFEDEDDPKSFKSALSTKIPIILKARNSKRELMHEWQERFAKSKATDVYAIFFNLIDFMNDYVEKIDSEEFEDTDVVEDLEELFTLNEDDDYNVPGVIGMGIKSSVLFFLNPEYFLAANKNTLYGFYFLSDCESFRLPSGTNEFIMINDLAGENNRYNNRNMLIDQNYWYPYDLCIFYGLLTYRKLKQLCLQHKYTLDDTNRFIHVNSFMSEIWNMKRDIINTMTGGDQEDAR